MKSFMMFAIVLLVSCGKSKDNKSGSGQGFMETNYPTYHCYTIQSVGVCNRSGLCETYVTHEVEGRLNKVIINKPLQGESICYDYKL